MKISRPPSSPPASPTSTPRPSVPQPVPPKPPAEQSPSDVFDGPVASSNVGDNKQGASGSSIRVGASASSGGQGIEDRDKFKPSQGPGGPGTTASGSSIRAGGRGNSGGTQGDPPCTPHRRD
ncbi:hypothetical protein [Corallococcus sp. AB038B]|uniref:hypothetical protein n=1 Tax=Corallococcus sp. AB038B TaxID=2316718 RepID=UPI000EDC9D09|nr:hypothetical protein [Corallococcus sp. AB038B]RKH93788.1 hypothetical protein D7Y04_38855 [Corallococcus sp. AB038B]